MYLSADVSFLGKQVHREEADLALRLALHVYLVCSFELSSLQLNGVLQDFVQMKEQSC